MTSRLLLILTIDGLRARALGAYGNTWFNTPELDQLASQGTVFDRLLVESQQLPAYFDALWSGTDPESNRQSLLVRLKQEGYLCHLVTDDPQLADRPDVEPFDDVTVVDSSTDTAAEEIMDCGMATTLAAAADCLGEWSAEYEQPRLLWVHLRGLTAAWDAPMELADSLLGEEDPPLEPSVEVPEQPVDDTPDAADQLLLAGCRYAGQVMALDAALGAVLALLDDLWPEEMPVEVVLTGTRGFALGEHGWLGLQSPAAHRELFHVPLLVRASGVAGMRRQAGLLQTSDLAPLLYQLATTGSFIPAERTLARGGSADSQYVENDEWSYVATGDASTNGEGELFVLPDDQWQANNVASRCGEEAEQMNLLLADRTVDRTEQSL